MHKKNRKTDSTGLYKEITTYSFQMLARKVFLALGCSDFEPRVRKRGVSSFPHLLQIPQLQAATPEGKGIHLALSSDSDMLSLDILKIN